MRGWETHARLGLHEHFVPDAADGVREEVQREHDGVELVRADEAQRRGFVVGRETDRADLALAAGFLDRLERAPLCTQRPAAG